MALPELNTARYTMVLPSTGETIEYRPYLVKEEKILMMAMESDFAGSEPQETLAKGEIAIKIDVNVVFALN